MSATPVIRTPIEWHSPRFAGLLSAFRARQSPLYVVGGAVRDHLLGRDVTTTDLDLTCAGPVLSLARRVADRLGWAFYPLDEERDVARLIGTDTDGQRLECDIAALRGDLTTDLLARDFTANALALELSAEGPPHLLDVCGGTGDIHARLLRRVTPDSLPADPIRLLRAVRLAAQLGFSIEPDTRQQIAACAQQISLVSVERVRDELWKLLALPRPDAGLDALAQLGLLGHLLPEVVAMQGVTQSPPHHLDVYRHSLLAMAYAGELRDWLQGGSPLADPQLAGLLDAWQAPLRRHFSEEIATGHSRADWLVWHALFHDTGKPASRSVEPQNADQQPDGQRVRFFGHEELSAEIAERRVTDLHFSRREAQLAARVARAHMRPHHLHESFAPGRVSHRAAFRFFRDTASGAVGADTGLDVLLQAIADRQATGQERGANWQQFLAVMESLLAFAFSPAARPRQPLVDGHTLMKRLEIAPGPEVGALLRQLAEAQAAGEISSPDEALALARKIL